MSDVYRVKLLDTDAPPFGNGEADIYFRKLLVELVNFVLLPARSRQGR